MNWHVYYNTMRDGRVEFDHDDAIGHPDYKPEGQAAEEAIESVCDYIAERYACNCFSLRLIDGGLEMSDPSDGEVVERYSDFTAEPYFILMGSDGKPYESSEPGQFGGHRRLKIYGRLDCPSANRAIAKGQYVKNRVFFKDEKTAIEAGYRPCGICLPEAYKRWKEQKKDK